MNVKSIIIPALAFGFLFTSCSKQQDSTTESAETPLPDDSAQSQTLPPPTEDSVITNQTVNFQTVNSNFKFTAQIPSSWQVEYVSASQGINIFDPTSPAETNLEKSQIFVKFFQANQFLTLSSVNILSRENISVSGHEAVKYEIAKKPSAKNFSSQPLWRNIQHKIIDIRLDDNNPTYFYVFAYNPELGDDMFNQFINSLIF